MARTFRNPSNQHIEVATTRLSWFWALMFGPFYLVSRGFWGHALVSCIAASLTFGLSNIFYAIAIYRIAPKHYLREGWVEIQEKQTISSAADVPKAKETAASHGWMGVGEGPALGIVAMCLIAFVAAMVLSKGIRNPDMAAPVGLAEAKANANAEQPHKVKTVERQQASRTPLRLSAGQAYSRTTSNELRFRREVEEAGGVIVSGRVDHIENGLLGNGPVISLRTGQPFINILATLEHSEQRKAERIEKGRSVQLLCHRPTTIGGAFAYLYDCKFR